MTAIPRGKPYKVTYRSVVDGQMHTIRRRPPPQLHTLLPEDRVILNHKKNDDWQLGEEYEVKAYTKRAPNTIKISNPDTKDYTYVPYYDLKLKPRPGVTMREDENGRMRPISNRYLGWP